ncbi:MAG: universal stress protein [Neomegalonema sp.]|nr:universal stress protein [Neomegalonema sp.]
MKTILVATDLSERSERAVRRAFNLAELHTADLTVLSIVDSDLPDDIAVQMTRATEAQLAQLCGAISSYSYKARVKTGDPQREIHAVADELDADLIVLGVHRERPWVDMVAGTTMERLVHASQRPVLLVSDPVMHSYRRVVCGLDMSPSCAAALRAAADLAPEAEIDLVHAVHVPFRGFLAPSGAEAEVRPFVQEARKRVDAWLSEIEPPKRCSSPKLIAASRVQALGQVFRESGADLIALGAHGRSSLAPTYLGSFTEELLRMRPSDILVVKR